MPTPEERLATKQHRFVLGVFKYQGNQCIWCPLSEEAPRAALPYEVSKHQGDQALIMLTPKEEVSRGIPLLLFGVYTHQDARLTTDFELFFRP